MSDDPFTVERVEEAFQSDTLADDVDFQALTDALNGKFTERDIECLRAMTTDHTVPLQYGELRIRERHGMDEWSERVDFSPPSE